MSVKNSVVLKALYTSAHLVIPCILNVLAPPQHADHGRDHRVWISLAQMGLRNTHHCYWEEPPTPSPSHLHPFPAPQIKLPHQLNSTQWGWWRDAAFLYHSMGSPVSLACWRWPTWILFLCKSSCSCSKAIPIWTRKNIFLDENPTPWGRLQKSKKREDEISGVWGMHLGADHKTVGSGFL